MTGVIFDSWFVKGWLRRDEAASDAIERLAYASGVSASTAWRAAHGFAVSSDSRRKIDSVLSASTSRLFRDAAAVAEEYTGKAGKQ